MKPQRHYSLAVFLVYTPFLVAQVVGSQEPAGFAPQFAGLLNHLSHRPFVGWFLTGKNGGCYAKFTH